MHWLRHAKMNKEKQESKHSFGSPYLLKSLPTFLVARVGAVRRGKLRRESSGRVEEKGETSLFSAKLNARE